MHPENDTWEAVRHASLDLQQVSKFRSTQIEYPDTMFLFPPMAGTPRRHESGASGEIPNGE
jgi:hypothetical protein